MSSTALLQPSIEHEEMIKDETCEDGQHELNNVEEVQEDEDDEDEMDPSQLLEINHNNTGDGDEDDELSWHQPQGAPPVMPTNVKTESLLAQALLQEQPNIPGLHPSLKRALQSNDQNGLPKMARLPDPGQMFASLPDPNHLFGINSDIPNFQGEMNIQEFSEERLKRIRSNASHNQRPRDFCPICGDRANGIHYGIYTCEGCKNFFKRSVGIAKPYVCKRNGPNNREGHCNVGLFEDDGRTRRRTRCQFCRFEACIDQGMVHMGTGVRSASTPVKKQQQHQVDPLDVQQNDEVILMDEEDKSASSPPSSRNEQQLNHPAPPTLPPAASRNHAQTSKKLQDLRVDQLQDELELFRSRVRELESTLREKDSQLEIQKRQIGNLTSQNELLKKSNTNLIMSVNGGSGSKPCRR